MSHLQMRKSKLRRIPVSRLAIHRAGSKPLEFITNPFKLPPLPLTPEAITRSPVRAALACPSNNQSKQRTQVQGIV